MDECHSHASGNDRTDPCDGDAVSLKSAPDAVLIPGINRQQQGTRRDGAHGIDAQVGAEPSGFRKHTDGPMFNAQPDPGRLGQLIQCGAQASFRRIVIQVLAIGLLADLIDKRFSRDTE